MQALYFRLGFRPCRELVALPALAHRLQGHAGWWGQQQCLAESDTGRVLFVSLEVVVTSTAKHPSSE